MLSHDGVAIGQDAQRQDDGFVCQGLDLGDANNSRREPLKLPVEASKQCIGWHEVHVSSDAVCGLELLQKGLLARLFQGTLELFDGLPLLE